MDELEAITEALRKQRQDLDAIATETESRGDETAKVLKKLEELRNRAAQSSEVEIEPLK